MGELMISGLRLRARNVAKSFGDWSTAWIQSLLLVPSASCPSIVTGNTPFPNQSINRQLELDSMAEKWMDDMIGYYSLELDLNNHS
jgi:hypothetical protein